MSRTKRNHLDGSLYIMDDEKQGRDKKPYNKPPKWFKQKQRRKERTQAKQDLHQGYQPEVVHHGDQWDWN